MTGMRLVLAALLVAVLQIGVLGWSIAERAAILRNGAEVLLKVEPIDPRDLMRGDYVRLGYEIRTLPVALIVNAPSGEAVTGDGPIYLRLGRDDDGYWRTRSASLDAPQATPPPQGEVDLRGEANPGWPMAPGRTVQVNFSIDRYYVPEGEGREIEANLRERPFGILAAVAPDGTPQIKALMDGDTPLYEEPLY